MLTVRVRPALPLWLRGLYRRVRYRIAPRLLGHSPSWSEQLRCLPLPGNVRSYVKTIATPATDCHSFCAPRPAGVGVGVLAGHDPAPWRGEMMLPHSIFCALDGRKQLPATAIQAKANHSQPASHRQGQHLADPGRAGNAVLTPGRTGDCRGRTAKGCAETAVSCSNRVERRAASARRTAL